MVILGGLHPISILAGTTPIVSNDDSVPLVFDKDFFLLVSKVSLPGAMEGGLRPILSAGC
jgi:hypothetical protein